VAVTITDKRQRAYPLTQATKCTLEVQRAQFKGLAWKQWSAKNNSPVHTGEKPLNASRTKGNVGSSLPNGSAPGTTGVEATVWILHWQDHLITTEDNLRPSETTETSTDHLRPAETTETSRDYRDDLKPAETTETSRDHRDQ